MITYQDIYEAAKRERYSDSLQPIPKNFVKEVAAYMKDKKEAASRDGEVFSDSLIKTKKQLENATTLFQELIRRRRKKILNLVLIASETGISKKDFENMLLIEKRLFEDLVKCFERGDKSLFEILNGGKEVEDQKNLLIVFLEEIEEFVAPSGQNYGPFAAGDFVNIPRDLAQIFIQDGKAELMEK